MHSNLIVPIPVWLLLLTIVLSIGLALMIKRGMKGYFFAKEESGDSSKRGYVVHHESVAERIDRTVNPYSRGVVLEGEDETVNPYSRGVVLEGEDETVNPYSRGVMLEGEDETVNPYSRGMVLEGEDETVNPYSRGMVPEDEGETENPYGWNMKAQNEDETVNPYYAVGNSLVMDEEKTVNPYAQDWMPKLTVGFILENTQGIRKKEMSFSGSMWIGSSAQCELQIGIPDDHLICVELTYGGGNLYARNISHSGEIVLLNNSKLGDDLVPLKKGSIIRIDQTQITIAYIR